MLISFSCFRVCMQGDLQYISHLNQQHTYHLPNKIKFHYHYYAERPNPEPLIKMADVRMKLKGRYIGMMCCEDLTAFVLVRTSEVPITEKECVEAATSLGLKGPGGRSYIYIKNLTRNEL